jgi:transposase InsO family protein
LISSVSNKPITDSARALSEASPTVPTEPLTPAAASRSVNAIEVYTARTFRQACIRLGIAQSMGRPGSALDNAVIESWHSTLEFELRSLHTFATRAQARAAVAAWIEDYNHVQRHSALGMVSPVDYERSLAGKDAA